MTAWICPLSGDQRPAGWKAPVLASVTSTACTAGTEDRRARARTAEDVVRRLSCSLATRIRRACFGPTRRRCPDDRGPEDGGPGRGGHARRRDRPLHVRAVAMGSETFVAGRAGGVVGVSEVWVGANFLFGRDRRAPSPCSAAWASVTVSAPTRSTPFASATPWCRAAPIRRLLAEGRVDEAASSWGAITTSTARWSAEPSAAHARFPTANLNTANELVPAARRHAAIAEEAEASSPR